jgi:hypothetical protein
MLTKKVQTPGVGRREDFATINVIAKNTKKIEGE